jgi:small nuclear ribonucleoprotein (snRNP)-like protein
LPAKKRNSAFDAHLNIFLTLCEGIEETGNEVYGDGDGQGQAIMMVTK